jgi:L-2-hydroxyglutarate oxidase LhgO
MPGPPPECDLVVVGAGIVGLAVAREMALRHDGISVCVLEREPAIAAHQTTHSSGVIHAGIYYAPGSLKARLCVAGARKLYAYCEERGIEAKRTGKLIVATGESELSGLDELERRGTANGVPGLRRLDAAQIREIEPHVRGIEALHSPVTGVVDFGRVAGALAEDLVAGGGSVATASEVQAISGSGDRATVRHAQGSTAGRAVIVCAGIWASALAESAGADPDPRIVPIRGRYLLLRAERAHLVRANVYPVPDPELPFLGAHLTRGPDGRVMLGPSAFIAPAGQLARTLSWPGTWRMMRRQWRTGVRELRRTLSAGAYVADARRLVPELRPGDFVAGPSGVRAQAVARDGCLVDDFIVSRSGRALHVRNAPSPAATASLALAQLIADEAEPLLST